MEHLKEQLEIKLAEAEDILEQTDVHDDLEYGKAQGVVEALRMALNLVVARRVENLEQEVEYMQQKRKEYTGPALKWIEERIKECDSQKGCISNSYGDEMFIGGRLKELNDLKKKVESEGGFW